MITLGEMLAAKGNGIGLSGNGSPSPTVQPSQRPQPCQGEPSIPLISDDFNPNSFGSGSGVKADVSVR
jgi:hypothetical protein